ncbi:lytic transglycosylase domain-containing protein [Curvibacter sp. HBC61]|uniref:Lytic transglycosylase domain-containing protein n=1 Tax=Curvibacter cyanobacteriorum TaxID=3026422 RepID=A0ABT5MSV3_9BURK|nr:lytic transglycosylase domain-containing protein [Curvibacter sp. HBC61]MDD0836990.1 lytic transglycosylase domain-containing protein [Curvibacter sp. HBC61]
MRLRLTSELRAWARAGLGAGLLACAPTWAVAEVWGYVDARGTPHFASEPLDARYELFYRGTADSSDFPRADTPRPVQVPTLQPQLLAFFDVSPGFKRAKLYMREAADSHGVDFELLQAMIATESGFDEFAVSPRGAVGLMQVMPPTAEQFGVVGDTRQSVEKKLTDVRINIQTGTRYLRHLMRLFNGRLDLALAAYNAGPGAVTRAGHQIPNIRETQNYVRTVTQLYSLLKPPPTVQAQRRTDQRVRVELPAVPGGAAGRGNMIEPLNARGLSQATLSALERNAIDYP